MMAWVARPRVALEDGDAEGGGFAGSGAGLAEEIDAGEGAGDEQGLDFGGSFEFGFGEALEDGGADAEGGEGLWGLGAGGFVGQEFCLKCWCWGILAKEGAGTSGEGGWRLLGVGDVVLGIGEMQNDEPERGAMGLAEWRGRHDKHWQCCVSRRS